MGTRKGNLISTQILKRSPFLFTLLLLPTLLILPAPCMISDRFDLYSLTRTCLSTFINKPLSLSTLCYPSSSPSLFLFPSSPLFYYV
ncbi:hypothetical protein BKA57DRAFT_473855 [Linnemannia elongata]|nr:hypothetical protein BKA57DRAFT_473855 [Linnemannia elongata]